MSKKRQRRSKEDLKKELKDQLDLLLHACSSFDNGLQAIGKHIALSLRVLLYQHGKSQALLLQLGLVDMKFLDTAGDLNPRNLLTECNLCSMKVETTGASFIPKCLSHGSPTAARWISFADWWNKPVIKDKNNKKFNRRELILNVADTDGGAHVDPELDEAYMFLSRENSLGWIFTSGNIKMPLDGPELQCVRQIAYEVIESLKKKIPTFFYNQ